MRISVVGDCVRDMVILAKEARLVKDPKNKKQYLSFIYGDKVNVDGLFYDLGGSACNAAVSLRKLGFKANMISMLGDDIYSKKLLKELRDKKIGTKFIVQEKNKDLGISFVLLGPDRDRTILTYRSNNNFSKIKERSFYNHSDAYYLAGINKYSRVLQEGVLEDAKKNNKPIFINPSGFQIEKNIAMLKKIIKEASIVIMNLDEAKRILRINRKIDINRLIIDFKEITKGIVVITDGKKGAHCFDGKTIYKSGIYPIRRSDTTGAGDSFASTFVAATIKGWSTDEALKLASVNSASVVSVYGAQNGLLRWRELKKMVKRGKVKIKKYSI